MKKRGGVFSAATSALEQRHVTSGLNSSFTATQLSFDEYVSASRDMIRQARADKNAASLEQAVNGNAPFELEPQGADIKGKEKPYRRGILLTHGLSDSPYFMRHLAEFFQSCGFRVLAVLLPGHGTRPGDLLDVTWQEWEKAVAYGTDKLAAEVDEVYLAGYSAGGALSIYQSLHDTRVRGLFLFAPALEITHRAAYAWLHKLVSWLLPSQKWLDVKPDIDIYKYESFAKNTAAQMYALTRVLERQLQLHALNIPVFAVASVDDKTVHTTATVEFMARLSNPCNKLILYTTEASKLAHDSTAERIEWVDSIVPEQKILSSAHTAILIPSDDKHYGFNGDYASCVHYYPDEMDQYEACSTHPQECWQGEVIDRNLVVGTLRRLMYNPNFASLKLSLQHFIDCLPRD